MENKRLSNFSSFVESKSKKVDVEEVNFDIKDFENDGDVDTDTTGFKSELEEMPKAAEKKLKKEIQVTTPGLKKSIKKFEDFQISVSIEPEENVTTDDECCSGCQCNPCECVGGECTQCNCNPCECESVDDVTKFVDFLKK